MKGLREYKKTYAGARLLEKYSLDTQGIWRIRGEDPNCDLGGHHHQPDLGLFDGTLREAIEHGTGLPGFWQWGAGGNFSLVEITKKEDDLVTFLKEGEKEMARNLFSTTVDLTEDQVKEAIAQYVEQNTCVGTVKKDSVGLHFTEIKADRPGEIDQSVFSKATVKVDLAR